MQLDVKDVTYIYHNKKKFDYNKLDALMKEALGIYDFTEGKKRLTLDQFQLVVGLLDVLIHKGGQQGEGNNEKNETDSGNPQVRKTDGYEDNRLQGERPRPLDDIRVVNLRSLSEVPDSPDVSDIPAEGRTDSERGLYDNQ